MGRWTWALLVWLPLAFASTAAAQEGRWLRAETAHFIVYGEGREEALRETARTLEQFDAVLRRLVPPGREASGKLEVYLFRSRDSLRRIEPDLPSDVVGFYAARPEIIAAFASYRTGGGLERQEVLFHEYAHHYMLHYFTQAYPSWFVEGFAEMVQTVEFRDEGAIVGGYSQARAAWIVSGAWLDIDRLLAPRRLSAAEAAQFYAQSWLATHYLMLNEGHRETLGRYLTSFQTGADPLEAFEPAFGITRAEFHRRLRDYARSYLPLYRVTVPPVADPQISRMSEAADGLLLQEVRLRLMGSELLEDDEWVRLTRQTGAHGQDAYAQHVFARAAILHGDYAQARAMLEPLAEAASADIETHYLLGLSYVIEGGRAPRDQCGDISRQSRRHFVRAFRLDETHVRTLYRYARSWQCDAEMPETARDVLLNAYTLAPQVSEITVNAAVMLMRRGEFEAATRMLRPVAYSPHGGADEQIMQLLEAAERGAFPGAEEEQPPKD